MHLAGAVREPRSSAGERPDAVDSADRLDGVDFSELSYAGRGRSLPVEGGYRSAVAGGLLEDAAPPDPRRLRSRRLRRGRFGGGRAAVFFAVVRGADLFLLSTGIMVV